MTLYFTYPLKSNRISDIIALVIPQVGHGTFVIYLIGHVMSNIAIKTKYIPITANINKCFFIILINS